MDCLWKKANEVSEVGYKVHSASMIIELVAERINDNMESGALWAAAEVLQRYSERMENLSTELMELDRESKKIKKKKKDIDIDGRC